MVVGLQYNNFIFIFTVRIKKMWLSQCQTNGEAVDTDQLLPVALQKFELNQLLTTALQDLSDEQNGGVP